MTSYVYITDVAPRDGLQNESGVISTADKLRLIGLLAASGVDEIEATSFVSPKWVPQLADAEEVAESLADASPPPVYSVLVPNARGYERFESFLERGASFKMAVFTAASETFNQKNTNATIAESIERFRAFVPGALERQVPIRLYISCAFACPYEGLIAPEAVRAVADQLEGLVGGHGGGASLVELDLGDTIGAATPESVEALFRAFEGSSWHDRLVLHLHDTHGRAADCIRAALHLGVRRFDASVAGIGGCPYAGTKDKPAPGNVATSILVKTILDEGFTCGADPSKLQDASDFATQIVAQARAQQVS